MLKWDFHGAGTLRCSNFHVIAFSVLSVCSRLYYVLSKYLHVEHGLRQHTIFKEDRGMRKGY